MCMLKYATPTLTTEVLHPVTQVQLLLTFITVSKPMQLFSTELKV